VAKQATRAAVEPVAEEKQEVAEAEQLQRDQRLFRWSRHRRKL
jgi:hypothetical protein